MDYDALENRLKELREDDHERGCDRFYSCSCDYEPRIDQALKDSQVAIADLRARNDALVEANGILEDALQEVGDDYPGSSCQEWCQQRVKAARAALAANREG